MSASSFVRIRDALNDANGSSNKADFSVATRVIFAMLNDINTQIKVNIDNNSFKDDNLGILEEATVGKKVPLTRSLQALLLSIYKQLSSRAPGYIVRSLLNCMVNVCNNKVSSPYGRECAISVLSHILFHRVNDCASQITDVYQAVNKFTKATELCVRIAATDCLNSIVLADNAKTVDMFVETSKTVVRLLIDKSSEIKISAMVLMETVAKYSNGFSLIPADTLLPALYKALEDENSSVQDMAARIIATVYNIQITTYTEKQEQSKIGAARGGSDGNSATSNQANKSVSAVSRLSLVKLPTLKKVVVEEVHDYRTVLENIVKLFMKSTNASRIGTLFALGYLIQFQFHKLSNEDIDWTLGMYVNMLQDPSIQSLSYEEQNVLRIKFSFNLRNNILAVCNENHLLNVASQLIKLCNDTSLTPPGSPSPTTPTANTRSELEIQFLLIEINHLLQILQCAGVSIVDDMMIHLSIYLRHMHYTIRVLAANVIVTICQISSTYIPYFVSNAILQIRNQIKPLSQFDQFDSSLSSLPSDLSLEDNTASNSASNTTSGSTTSSPNPVTNTTNNLAPAPSNMSTSQRRRSLKDMEKLQRIYCLHGYILVIYCICQHLPLFSQSLSNATTKEILELGIELMSYDVTMVTNIAQKNIVCSFIRAGSLLLTAMCTLGYKKLHNFVPSIIQLCITMVQSFEKSSISSTMGSNSSMNSSSPVPFGNSNSNEELLYEVMTMETAIIILISAIKHIPEISTHHITLMSSIVQCLESSYSLLKNKYQVYYKSHYRVRILNILLLELYTLIPSGFYPSSSSTIYVETLKIIRDHVSNSLECTLGKLAPLYEDFLLKLQHHDTEKRDCFWLTPLQLPFLSYECNHDSDVSRIYQLEYYVNILSRKENESFLSVFNSSPVSNASLHQLNNILPSNALFPSPESSYWTGHHDFLSCLSIHNLSFSSDMKSSLNDDFYRMIGNTYQSACIENRTADVAIQLLAITFPHQSSEFQDKAIQLFTQALQQILTSSGSNSASGTGNSGSGARLSITGGTKGMSLFTSSVNEEEKRRKEKKNAIAMKTIVVAIHAIVNQFPLHSGQYYDADYAWRQTLVDTLYSILNFASSSSGASLVNSSTASQYATYTGVNPLNALAANDVVVRLIAAQSLIQFADKWKGSNITSHISSRIRTNIIMSFEKKVIDMNDFNGYVSMLGYLWIRSPYLSEVQSLVQTTLFDCLRKADSSVFFQSHVFTSITMIVNWFLHNNYEYHQQQQGQSMSNGDNSAILVPKEAIEDLFEKIIYVTEFSLMHVNVPEDLQVYVTSLLQLMNTCLALGLLYEVSTEKYISRLYQIWNLLLSLNHTFQLDYDWCHQMKLKKLQFQGIGMMLTYDKKKLLTSDLLAHFESAIGFHDEDEKCCILYDFNPSVILEVTNVLWILSCNDSALIMERGYLVCFYTVYDVCYEHLVKCTFSETLPGTEIKFDQINCEYNYTTIINISSRVRESLLALIHNDISQHSPSHRLLFWLLLQRNIALGVKDVVGHSGSSVNKNESPEDNRGDDFDDDDRGTSQPNSISTSSTSASLSNQYNEMLYLHNCQDLLSHFRELIQQYTPKCAATYASSLRLSLKILSMQVINSLMHEYFPNYQQMHIHLQHASTVCQTLIENQPQHKWTKLDIISQVPWSFGWFLNEFINLACTMTTYTVNDFNILPLQSTGVKLLADIVSSFIRSDDLEAANSTAESMDRLILNQYLSQILSAIRTVLSGGNSSSNNESSHNSASKVSVLMHLRPEILQDVQVLLNSLIQGSFIQDKIMLKRVLKPIISFCEVSFSTSLIPSDNDASVVKTRFPMSKEFEECQYIQEQCVYMNLIHHLLSSTTLQTEGVFLSNVAQIVSNKKHAVNPVQSSLISSFQEFLPYIHYFGKHIFYDTLRMLLYHPENNNFNQDHELPKSIVQIKLNNAADASHLRTWEQFSKELHPLRGGNTYTSFASYAQLLSLLPFYIENCYLQCLNASNVGSNQKTIEILPEKEFYLFLIIFSQRLDPTHSYTLNNILEDNEHECLRSLFDLNRLWEYFFRLFLCALKLYFNPMEQKEDKITWDKWIYLLQVVNKIIQQSRNHSPCGNVVMKWNLKHYLLLSQILTILTSSTDAISMLTADSTKSGIEKNSILVSSFAVLYELSNSLNFILIPCLFSHTSTINQPQWLSNSDENQVQQFQQQVGMFLYETSSFSVSEPKSSIDRVAGDNLEESYHTLAIQQTIQNTLQLSKILTVLKFQVPSESNMLDSIVTEEHFYNQFGLYILFFAMLQSCGANNVTYEKLLSSTITTTRYPSRSKTEGQNHYLITASKGIWDNLVSVYPTLFLHNKKTSPIATATKQITMFFVWLWTAFPSLETINPQYSSQFVDYFLQIYYHTMSMFQHDASYVVQSTKLPQLTTQNGNVYSIPKVLVSLLLRSYQQANGIIYTNVYLTLIKYIQYFPHMPLSNTFQASILPLMLSPSPSNYSVEIATTHLKGFMLLFNLLFSTTMNIPTNTNVERYLSKTLPWLCNSIHTAQAHDVNYVILTGKALTQIARSSPDLFKQQILLLSDEQRQSLQLAMKAAILQEQQQQQQQHSVATNGGAASGGNMTGGMKISLDKYKK